MENSGVCRHFGINEKRKQIVYYYRGPIERGAAYCWVDGYSETMGGYIVYPWNTRGELRLEAKRKGLKAVFVRDNKVEHFYMRRAKPSTKAHEQSCG